MNIQFVSMLNLLLLLESLRSALTISNAPVELRHAIQNYWLDLNITPDPRASHVIVQDEALRFTLAIWFAGVSYGQAHTPETSEQIQERFKQWYEKRTA